MPLIHPSTKTSNASPKNTRPEEGHLQYFGQREQLSKQKTENQETLRKVKHRTDKMAPKQSRAIAKTKELQTAETPLMRRLRNIKNAKIQETSRAKTWAKIKEWAYVDKKITPTMKKIKHSTIMNYMNTPFMASFGGTKETTVKFIISRYHNDIFYFDKPFEISGEVI